MLVWYVFFFFKQKTAYEMRISDWSSDVCSSDLKVKVTATCVRVPVFVGHSEAINIEFENEISAEQAQNILREAPGVMLVDKREDGGYVTPVECVGDYATFISRVREDSTIDNEIGRASCRERVCQYG